MAVSAKQYDYKGIRIVRSPFGRYQIPQLHWGPNPGEFHSFSTLTAAQAFIDRHEQRNQQN